MIVTATIHLTDEDKIEVIKRLKENDEHFVIDLGFYGMVFLKENKLEELHKAIEKELYEESYIELEEKYYRLQAKADKLLEENACLRAKLNY